MERDHPNSASMGRRNRLKVLMPIDVMVTTAAQRSRTVVRDRCMKKEAITFYISDRR
jgi:hypothetical protein